MSRLGDAVRIRLRCYSNALPSDAGARDGRPTHEADRKRSLREKDARQHVPRGTALRPAGHPACPSMDVMAPGPPVQAR